MNVGRLIIKAHSNYLNLILKYHKHILKEFAEQRIWRVC